MVYNLGFGFKGFSWIGERSLRCRVGFVGKKREGGVEVKWSS